MKRTTRYAVRFFALLIVVSALMASAHVSQPAPGPYASALSNLAAASNTFAASSCNNKGCAGGSRHNIVCAKVTSATDCFNYQGFCISQNCQ